MSSRAPLVGASSLRAICQTTTDAVAKGAQTRRPRTHSRVIALGVRSGPVSDPRVHLRAAGAPCQFREAMMIVASSPLWVVEFVVTADEAVRRFRERHEATDLDEAAVRERVDNFSYWDKAY